MGPKGQGWGCAWDGVGKGLWGRVCVWVRVGVWVGGYMHRW